LADLMVKAAGALCIAKPQTVASGSRLVEFDSIFGGFPVPSSFGEF
jgi:hypothetical protein